MTQLARTLGLLLLGLVIAGPDLAMAQWVKPGIPFICPAIAAATISGNLFIWNLKKYGKNYGRG